VKRELIFIVLYSFVVVLARSFWLGTTFTFVGKEYP
jgi:hypothetical protein